MDTDTALKRQKSTTPTSASSPQPSSNTLQGIIPSASLWAYMEHSRFWVQDKNVLLQLGIVRFKLHRSRLMSQSHWFAKLVTKHAGVTCNVDKDDDSASIDGVLVETAEGLDVFILDSAGVSVEDFEALLVAMDDGIDFYFAAPSFRTVARILRAATTLHFHKLLKFAKTYVEGEFSDDIEEVTEESLEHAVEAVVLGRDWGIPLILKRAFYELARHDNREDEDEEEEEGSQDNEDEYLVSQLNPHDLLLLMHGQKHLTAAWTVALAMKSIKSCKSKCKGSRAGAGNQLFQPPTPMSKKSIIQKYQFDPICRINWLINGDWKGWGYCTECAQL
ncbi:hypothetical protein BDZ94DRAFT_1166267 [Collybia nuda]|uniref:BTB domain-containing protein n=1 Tax=Collybia nuda TaxID=64659 RepID=A0A9P5Y2I1_9AGAR|nr:hypothetical protein BDZ94DRAFT_1166267 [Collybia nuda]